MVNSKKDYLVGVNYFSGWWRQEPNKYKVSTLNDWRVHFPDRTALLGCYNDQETMDAEIIAAAEHAVDFFQILWYVEKPERHPHGSKLNAGLRQFISSPESYRLHFFIEFCNHPPFEIIDEGKWEESCREWIDAMLHPQYLRIGKKALFKVHGLRYFIKQNANDPLQVAHRIEKLRSMAVREGVGELLIGAGVLPTDIPVEDTAIFLKSFDFHSVYMGVPDLPAVDTDYPYELLNKMALEANEQFSCRTLLPYMPYVPAGWNPRPWKDPRPSFTLPDAEQWKKALEDVKLALDLHYRLRLPDGTDHGQKIFNIYAWNEFGEGGIVAPTIGDGWMKLEKIHEIFGK